MLARTIEISKELLKWVMKNMEKELRGLEERSHRG